MSKEMFVKAIRRFQNYYSHLETKNKLLEKAFGSDSCVMDFSGLEELRDSIVDLTKVIFPSLLEKVIADNIDWYLYEVPMLEGDAEVFDGERKYNIKSPEDLFDMLSNFNKEMS